MAKKITVKSIQESSQDDAKSLPDDTETPKVAPRAARMAQDVLQKRPCGTPKIESVKQEIFKTHRIT